MALPAPPPASVLVYVGLDLVGDGLIKLPFVRALRNAFPEARIVWLAGKGRSAYAGSLAPLVRGLLDEVVDDAGWGANYRDFLRPPLQGTPLAGQDFDLVLDTQRRLRTTLLVRRIPHREFVSACAGFLLSDRRPRHRKPKPPAMLQQLFDLLELATGAPPVPEYRLQLDPQMLDLAAALLPAGQRYIGLAPGAGDKRRCWPLERYLELAAELSARGDTPVFLLGPQETDWIDLVRQGAPGALIPEHETRSAAFLGVPTFTVALATRMSAAVANDSGTGHMLAAADVPLLSLFGPTAPEKFAPRVSRARILRGQDFGDSGQTSAIPLSAVREALDSLLVPAGR